MTDRRRVRSDYAGVADAEGALPDVASDLLSLSREAWLLDRCIPRGKSPDDPRWRRTLHLRLPVRDPDRWAQPSIVAYLRQLLRWMTDDDWTIEFLPDVRHPGPRQLQLRLTGEERRVMLFSGGLDATAGAALLGRGGPLVGVGVATNSTMKGYQGRASRALASAGLVAIEYLPVTFSVVAGEGGADASRRTRGLVFLCTGSAAALVHGQDELLLAENGIGALNLPFSRAQHGVMTSRAVHPSTLRLMAGLVSELTGSEFRIRNPFLTRTKGQMLAALPIDARAAVAASQSCDYAAAGRGRLQRRCGFCTSCLLRRVSLHAANRADWDGGEYLSDLQPNPDRSRLPEILWQAARLDHALSGPSSALKEEFPAIVDLSPLDMTEKQLRSLLREYVEEWRSYPDPQVQRFLTRSTTAAAAHE